MEKICVLLSLLIVAAVAEKRIVIAQVGNGVNALTSASTQVALNEYSLTGALISSTVLNGTTISGTATSEGALTINAFGQWCFAGYDTLPGVPAIANTNTSAIQRKSVVGSFPVSLPDNLNYFTTYFSQGNPRSCVSSTEGGVYMSGSNNGIIYFETAFGDNGNQIVFQPNNTRFTNIFGDTLYGSSGSANYTAVYQAGSGFPTDPVSTFVLPGLVNNGLSPYSFFFLDVNPNVDGNDVLYISEDGSTGATGGIRKYTYNGATWTFQYLLNNNASLSIIHLYALINDNSATTVDIYAIASGKTLYHFVDTPTGYTYTVVANLTSTGYVYRGLVLYDAPDAATTGVQATTAAVTSAAGTTASPTTGAFATTGNYNPTVQQLYIVKVGDGSSTLNGNAAAVSVDQYNIDGTFVASTPLSLTQSGSATSEGSLSIGDGSDLCVAGYNAAVGTVGVASTSSTVVKRVAVSVNVPTSATSTYTTSYISGGNARSCVVSGAQAWLSGSVTGVVYFSSPANVNGTVILNNPSNVRFVNIWAAQLFGSSASGAFDNVFSIGAGLPTTPSSATVLNGLPVNNNFSPYSFALLDLNGAVAGVDTLYVGDDGTGGATGGIYKYSYDGSTWTFNYIINNGTSQSAAHIYATPTIGVSGSADIFAVVSGRNLFKFVDTAAGFTFTQLAVLSSTPSTLVYRGIVVYSA